MRVVMFFSTTSTCVKCNVFNVNDLAMFGVLVVIFFSTTRTCENHKTLKDNNLPISNVRVVPTGQV